MDAVALCSVTTKGLPGSESEPTMPLQGCPRMYCRRLPLDHEEITRVFLNYFEKKKHLVIPGASIIPGENDPSTLFVNAGMYPLKPYFLGIVKPPSKRLADIQRCVRTIDIERVGNARTLTFFHMLGSWSIGDYWKEEAVELSIGLLRSKSGFGLDESRLWVTVFAGDAAVPRDV